MLWLMIPNIRLNPLDKKSILIAILLSAGISSLWSQTHYNTWFRLSLGTKLSKKTHLDLEFQQRFQNGLKNNNPFNYPLLNSGRVWISYDYRPKIKFLFSPIAYFRNHKLIVKINDIHASINHEIRANLGVEFKETISPKFTFGYRLLAEGRDNLSYHTSLLRIRNKLGISAKLNTHCSSYFYDELLLNAISTNGISTFDQNRIHLGIQIMPNKNIKVDLGLMELTRATVTSKSYLNEFNYSANVYCSF